MQVSERCKNKPESRLFLCSYLWSEVSLREPMCSTERLRLSERILRISLLQKGKNSSLQKSRFYTCATEKQREKRPQFASSALYQATYVSCKLKPPENASNPMKWAVMYERDSAELQTEKSWSLEDVKGIKLYICI